MSGASGANRVQSNTANAAKARVDADFGRLPLAFEANQGQSRSRAEFLAHGRGYALFLNSGEARLRLQPKKAQSDGAVVRMQLRGANRAAKAEALDVLPGKANYFLGGSASNWRTGIPTFARVRYREVYPGIDIIYYGNQGRLEYDFAVASGADPNRIELEFSGIEGARVDSGGDLLLNAAGSELRLHRPLLYQPVSGARRQVEGRYRLLADNRVRFEVGGYDRSKPLVIDPVLSYGAVVGGSDWELIDYRGKALAKDSAGNIYITGATWSTDLPIVSPGLPAQGSMSSANAPDAFVAKLSADGSTLLFSTYLGGSGEERSTAIGVDAAGTRVVFGGHTDSTNFPTSAPFQNANNGPSDAFIAGLNAVDGSLAYSTYLGGAAADEVFGIAVGDSPAGTAFVAGSTGSADFPSVNAALGTTASGAGDAFVASFDPSGTLLFSGVLGGSGEDAARAIATFGGDAYVTGITCAATLDSRDFPGGTEISTGGNCDAFITRVSAVGATVWSRFLGGTGQDEGWAIAADANGVYVTGTTYLDFPVVPAGISRSSPVEVDGFTNADAFLAKLPLDGSALSYSMLFGGDEDDFPFAIAADPSSNPVVAGVTKSLNFPVSSDAIQIAKLGASRAVFTTSSSGASWTDTAIRGLTSSTILRQAPGSPATFYVSDGTWVYKSADSGATFPHVSSLNQPSSTVNDLAVDRSAASTVYAATAGSGVQKSTDDGERWSTLGTGPLAVAHLVAIAADASTMYASSGAVLYKGSTAGGVWTPVITPWPVDAAVTRIVPDRTVANTVYVGTEAGLFKTVNGGTGWTSLTPAPCARFQSLTMSPAGALYVADAGQFCRSTDGGATWTSAPTGNAQPATAIAVDPAAPATIHIAFGTFGIYKSTDTGATWAKITSAAPFRVDNVHNLAVNQGKLIVGVSTYPDVFVARFNAPSNVPAIVSATYLGGPGSVDMSGMAADANSVYVLVPNSSTTFPHTAGAYQSPNAASNDAHIVKIANTGTCSLSFWPASAFADAGGGAGRVRVIGGTGSGCNWGALSTPSWITTQAWSGGGSGLGLVDYTAAPNGTGQGRSGDIRYGAQTFTVTQASLPACTLAVSGPLSFTSAGGAQTFTVTPTPSTCSWTAVSNDSGWLTLTSNAAGTGTLQVGVSAAANATSAARTGTITVLPVGASSGGVTETVVQNAPITISVAPATASLYQSQTQQFTATVANAVNASVEWSISPPNVGTVSTSGLYSAPATISAQQTVSVIATSIEDRSKSSSATVTLRPPVTVSLTPASTVLRPAETQQFTAAVTNASNTAVTWSRSPALGTISATGLYTAPSSVSGSQVVTITATSVADSSKTASATVTVSVLANLAQGKTATQSSTGYNAFAANAVDGNTNGNYSAGSITHTNLDANAWWQVDLGASASVDSIAIWNRIDCCGNRLGDYWIFVSDTPFGPADTPTTLQTRAGTWSNHQTAIPSPSLVIGAGGVQGRYVRVQLSGTNFLSLAEVQVLGVWATGNLAQGKTATQSSTGWGGTALKALDGNTNGNFSASSTTHTDLDANAWWQVDLGTSATVDTITVWNRTDCCSSRLSDYWIFVSDTPFGATDTPTTLQARSGTWNSHQTAIPSPSTTVTAGGVRGRYVRVQMTGAGYLALAEVQVRGTWSPTNLAQGKTAAQSSTGYGATAVQAVDGNTNGNYSAGSITHTDLDANAWWQVDLGASAKIDTIKVWNRTDCCGNRLSDFWIFVSDTPFGPADSPATLQTRAGTWSNHQTAIPSTSVTITAGAVQGRYVRVQLSGTNYLSLAEVEVSGNWVAGNLAQGKTATQSSTGWGGPALNAVDGNTNGNLSAGSTTHTDLNANAWWQVDLGASATIDTITVWNRTDCCSNRLRDYWIFVSETPFGPTDTPTTLQGRSGTWNSHQTAIPSPSTTVTAGGVRGRYVRVQLTGQEFLSIAEVEVTAVWVP